MALTKIDDRGLKTPIDLLDNEKIRLGTGNDLELYHDGSNSFIQGGHGNLHLRAKEAENSVAAIPDGGVELYYDNSKKLETTSTGTTVTGNLSCTALLPTGNLELVDSNAGNVGRIRIGASDDFQIYHDGTNNIFESNNGEIRLMNGGEYMLRAVPNAAIRLYYDNSTKAETLSTGFMVNGHLDLVDNNQLRIGSSQDLQIYHDGTESRVQASNGPLDLRTSTSHNIEILANDKYSFWGEADGMAALYHNGTRKAYTSTDGFRLDDNLRLDDSKEIRLGNGEDLKIYHDGSHSYIDNEVGSFYIRDTGGAERVRINGYGTAITGGLLFGTDTAAANALNDYEEGSFTPALGGMSSISYHRQHGYYTKIGRQVWMHIYLYVYQATGNSNKIRITNLPFTASNASSGYIQHGGTLWYQNDTFKSSFNSESKPSIYIDSGDSFARFISQAGSEINGNDTYLGSGANNRYIICGLQMIV